MSIVRDFKLYMNSGSYIPPIIHVNQYDEGETWKFTLFQESGKQYIPSSAVIIGTTASGALVTRNATIESESGKVVVKETRTMTQSAGKNEFELVVDDGAHGTANFFVDAEPRPNKVYLTEHDLKIMEGAIEAGAAVGDLVPRVNALAAADVALRKAIDDAAIVPAGSTVVVDASLSISGAAADAKKTGDAVTTLKSALTAGRSGTFILNPMAFYRYTQDGVTAVDFSTMPLNTYVYAQFSAVKSALINANFPLSWSDTDYIHMVRLAATNHSGGAAATSIIRVFNFTKTQSAEMLYFATSSDNKYRWLLPTTDFTKEYLPADAKAVGDALAEKQDVSTLINGRNDVVLNPWGAVLADNVGGNAIDFRTFPMNTSCYTIYQKIKQGLSDTNMPETDWADNDFVVICRTQISVFSGVENSIITLYNFTRTRKLEMIYFANSQVNKYRWLKSSGGTVINNNTFENTINQYSNSYNVSASPSITTDTNNYLQPTGDQTDMATAIVTMLTQTGVCNLAPGDFYVSGIEMPDDTMIRGCGASTNIILLSSVTNGSAIKMGSRCIVDSVMVSGGTAAPTITSDIGTRDGILWQGTAIPGQSTISNTPIRGMISNCIVRNFSGSGIKCYGTGTGVSNCLNVSNVYVYNSTVGVNIEWLSEFHRFTNVDCRGCYYGIINNGGNNMFANCGFSKNIIGLLMDNTYGQSGNNSHGSFSNCVFNHSGNDNDGVAIKIIGCTNGEIFNGCQLFYGEIVIEESEGIVFANCNFGGSSGTQITITNGGLIMYNGCCFKNMPTVTKSGNTATKFANCYLRDGTAVTVS